MYAIQTHQLTKSYGKHRGIERLDLTVQHGELFGFIGPNGAGKSTTIRTLLGLIKPTSGSAQVLGLEVGRQQGQILRRVGYLPSETQFYAGMTARDLLKLSADLRGLDCQAECRRLSDRLQLDLGIAADQLSLGNRKKVGIVAALQHQPDLLILDEPTSGLDPLIQEEFFALLEERRQAGGTVFLSSHVLSEVQNHCDRAAIIRQGQIVATEDVASLMKHQAKRVSLSGQVPGLADLAGVSNWQAKGKDQANFLYQGDLNALLACLAGGQVRDFSLAEPSLEEIFRHYYQEGGDLS